MDEIAHWTFDSEPDAMVDSATGLKETFHSRTCSAILPHGISNRALLLDGYSVWLSRAGSRAPALGSEFTIQLWAALESYPTSKAAFVDQQNGTQAGYFFGLDQFGFLRFELSVDGDWGECASTEPIPRFEWVHLAASFDSSGLMTLYRNGLRIASTRGKAGQIRLAKTVELLVGKTNGSP